MKLYAVETLRANGIVLFDAAYVHLFDAVDDAEKVPPEDACCPENTSDDDYIGECPGGCLIHTPCITVLEAFKAERQEPPAKSGEKP